MGYSNTEDVKAIVDTDMEVAEIQTLIDMIDALIRLKIVVAGLDALVLKALSSTWTAYRVMLKDPTADRIGDISSDRKANLMGLKAEYMEMIDDAIASGGLAFSVGKAEYIR